MTPQTPTVYAYKNWFGRWKFKFLSGGLPRADKPVALFYHKPMDYDTLAISADAWQKVARESIDQIKDLRIRVEALTAELKFTKNDLERFYEGDPQPLATVPAVLSEEERANRGAGVDASSGERKILSSTSDRLAI